RGVALAERAAAAVLPRESHRRALGEERAEGERLGRPPVDRAVLRDHLAAALEQRAELRVEHESGRHARDPLGDHGELREGDAGRGPRLGKRAREAGPGAARLVGLVGPGGPRLDRAQRLLELPIEVLFDPAHVARLEHALPEQLLLVEGARALALADLLVE